VTAAAELPALEGILERLPPRLRGVAEWLLSRWPGRFAMRTMAGCIRIELFDRSMAIAAQLFTSVFPILILLASWFRPDESTVASTLAVPDQTMPVLEDALGTTSSAAFGVAGSLIVLASATSLSRALTRAYAAIWGLPRPKTSLGSAWRWLAAVLALALSLVVARQLVRAAGHLPPREIWELLAGVGWDVLLGLFLPWVLLAGRIRPRALVPGALVFGLVMVAVRPVSAIWLPHALDASAARYGTIGVAFSYLAWLYVVALCFLAANVVGYVLVSDDSAFGRLLRGGRPVISPDAAPGRSAPGNPAVPAP
jgi:membrane protein